MPSDTVTLFLDGEPTLDEFATALDALRDMLNALATTEHVGEVTWAIDALEAGTALATFRGTDAPSEDVRRVSRQYLAVGTMLRDGKPVPAAVEPAARRLLGVLNGRVPSIRFETADDDATVFTGTTPPRVDEEAIKLPGSYGAIEGRVQTLSNRGSLRFTLYDQVRDKAVSCYLQEGQEDVMRDAWGRVAVVEGWIRRDAATGRPQTIRRVRNVTFLDEGIRGEWRRADGVLRNVGSDEPAELTVRRLRDAQ